VSFVLEKMPTIKLYASLRKTAGQKEVSITGASLRTCVSALVEAYPALDGVILQDGQIPPHLIITINGRNVMDFDVAVDERDQIAIFPPIAGG